MIYFSQYSTHSVLLRFQCRFRSERYYPGGVVPRNPPHVMWGWSSLSQRGLRNSQKKNRDHEHAATAKNCRPKAVTGRIGCTSGQTRWCMQKITLRKEGFLFGWKEKEVREPARPISACTILILCNSHKHASKKKQKEIPSHRMTGTRGSHFDRKKEAASLQRSTFKCRNRH